MYRVQRLVLLSLFLAPAALGAPPADDLLVAISKQRAAASGIKWEVRDGEHKKLGPIKVALALTARTTDAGRDKIVSSVYVSCEKDSGRIAIELANARAAEPSGGLGPKDPPRLICIGVARGGVEAKTEIPVRWETNELGDELARGLGPAELRRCASINILQNVVLPAGWPRATQDIAIEIAPYGRELDAVFTACGETTAYAAATEKPAEPAAAPASWQRAHTIAKGRTNVRSQGTLASSVVTQLPPNDAILVQQAPGDWWRVRPRNGSAYEGYIRRDRFNPD